MHTHTHIRIYISFLIHRFINIYASCVIEIQDLIYKSDLFYNISQIFLQINNLLNNALMC